MNAKSTIRKVLFVALWLCIGGGMVTLLLAAITRKKNGQCNDYTISIKGKTTNYFIDEKDVQQLLMKATGGSIKGQPVASFELYQLEQMLEHNTWINDAELYFDNQDILHVTVTEKIPVARIFTVAGESFYIDSLGKKMPLSEKLSARVPVFTNFPDKKVLSVSDSLLLNNVKTTANFILNHPFWMAQVAQVDINEDRTFDMIPVVGYHTVKLGDGNHIDQKFHRLYLQNFRLWQLMITCEVENEIHRLKPGLKTKLDSMVLVREIIKIMFKTKVSYARKKIKFKISCDICN